MLLGHTVLDIDCRFSDRIPFRERSETASIAIELSMQPWEAFRPDGVIMFSDILTPLPALGVEFDVVKGKGPIIASPIRRWAWLLRTGICLRKQQLKPHRSMHAIVEVC
jgi:uroporphyrinogen-III decarboxylase